MKTIYMVLVHTNTLFSRFVHQITKAPYTHVAISLDRELTRVYGMARVYANNPFYLKLRQEHMSMEKGGIYAKNNGNTSCAIYALNVSEEIYAEIENQLEVMLKERKRYRYNRRGIIANYFGKDYQKDYHYFCSEFIADLLIKAGALPLERKACSYRPIDFAQIPQAQIVYSGNIKELKNYLAT